MDSEARLLQFAAHFVHLVAVDVGQVPELSGPQFLHLRKMTVRDPGSGTCSELE